MQRPGSLSCGTSVCLSMHPSLKPLRSRQKAQPSSPSPPPFPRAYFSDFLRSMEMDKEMQAPGSAVRAGVSASGLFTLCPPPPPPPQRVTMGQWGQTAPGCGAPRRQGWDIKAGSAGPVRRLCEPAPIAAGTPGCTNCIRAALPTCIPDWSRPGPSCIPGLEEAEGPGLFVLPKSGLRTMTG